MKAVITIKESSKRKAVSARELYEGLGYNPAHWAKWYKKNIEDNQFAIVNEDWVGFTLSVNGNETKDFVIEGTDYQHLVLYDKIPNCGHRNRKDYAPSIYMV